MRKLTLILVLGGAALVAGTSPLLTSSSSHATNNDQPKANNASSAGPDAGKPDPRAQQLQDNQAVSTGQSVAQTGIARPEISSGPVYSKIPELTPQQKKELEQGAEDEATVPVAKGRVWSEIPRPSDPPTQPTSAANITGKFGGLIAPQAANDFRYQQVTDLTSFIPALSEVNEPSVANMGNTVFVTGNWYAARSADGGQTFTYVSPTTTFIPAANGGFCCDQVANYAPGQDMMLWGMQYKSDGTTNTIRIARAVGSAAVASNSWISYRFTPQDFGFPTGTYLDFPNLTFGSTFLYVTANVYSSGGADQDSQGTFTGSVIMRLRLTDLAAGGTINYSYYAQSRAGTDVGSLRCTEGAGTTMYWAGWRTTSQLRIFHWDDTGTSIFWDDVNTAAFTFLNKGEGVATGPDGTNFAARADSRILGAWVANPVIGLMWAAKQDSTFPYPYVIVGRFDQNTRARLSQNSIWNSGNAWLYPTASPNGVGNLAGLLSFGGGSNYPGTNVWIVDDVETGFSPLGLHGASGGTNGPSSNKWGDYLTVRPHKTFTNTWVAATYSLKSGGSGSNAVPRYLWFGRERDFGASPSPTPTPSPSPSPSPSPNASPSPSPSPSPTPQTLPFQLVLDQSGPQPNQAAALDSLLFFRDPFPVINVANLLSQGSDRNTRVVIFAANLQIGSGETPAAVVISLLDSTNQSFDVPAEDVRAVPNQAFTQVIFRLPDAIAVGLCKLRIKARGLVSNLGAISIAPKSAGTSPTINSLGSMFGAPAQLVSITGTGFDPAYQVSVRFTGQNGISVDVPVVEASSTSLLVSVPPLINSVTGEFTSGVADVRVVERLGTVILTSNTISGFSIQSLPNPSGPAGRVAANLVGTYALVLGDVKTRLGDLESRFPGAISTSGLRTALEDLRAQSALLENQIRQVMANPNLSIPIGQMNGVQLNLNQDNLRKVDQLLAAYLVASSTASPASERLPGAPLDNDPCALGVQAFADGVLKDPDATAQALQRWNQMKTPCTATTVLNLGKKSAGWAGVLGTGLALGGVPLGFQALATMAYLPVSASVFGLLVTSQEIALGRENKDTALNAKKAIELFQSQIIGPLQSSLIKVVSPDGALALKVVKAGKFVSQELQSTLDSIRFDLFFPAGNEVYKGPFSGSGPFANTLNDCTFNVTLSGSITMTISQTNGTVQGSAHVTGSWSNTVTGGTNCIAGGAPFDYTIPVTGTTSNVHFAGGDFPSVSFQGSQSGTFIIGSATFTYTNTTGSIVSNVTLSKQP